MSMFKRLFGDGAPPQIETAGFIHEQQEADLARVALHIRPLLVGNVVVMVAPPADLNEMAEKADPAKAEAIRAQGERIMGRIYEGPFTIAAQVKHGSTQPLGTIEAVEVFGEISRDERVNPNTPFASLTSHGGRQTIGFNLMPQHDPHNHNMVVGYTTIGDYFGNYT